MDLFCVLGECEMSVECDSEDFGCFVEWEDCVVYDYVGNVI